MPLRKGKVTILCALGLGGAVLLSAGFIYRNHLIDSWFIHRLGSEDVEESQAAAVKLFERGSVRAIPALVQKVAALNRRMESRSDRATTPINGNFPRVESDPFKELRNLLVSEIAKLVTRDPHGSSQAFYPLLRHESPDISRISLEILLPLQRAIQIEDLIPWLDAEAGPAFQLACYFLYSAGPKAIPLLEATASGHVMPRVRRHAADLLDALRVEEGLPARADAGAGRAASKAPAPPGAPSWLDPSWKDYEGVFICCDKSGSMMESHKFRRLQEELVQLIGGLEEGTQFGLSFFQANMSAIPWKSRRPIRASPALKAAGQGFVLAMRPGGGSCPLPALLRCVEYAKNSTARSSCILFITDGTTTCPGLDASAYGLQLIDKVSEMNTGKVPLHAILMTNPGGADEPWLQDLASRNGGSYQHVSISEIRAK